MKLTVASIAALAILAFFLPQPIEAKRLVPQAKPAGGSSGKSVSKGVGAAVKFRGDRKAVVATFSNLGIASSVTYTLTYMSGGVAQGAGGTVSTSGTTVSKEIIFGTCSAGVCRYDTGIREARLVVTTTLKNGTKVNKPFRLKV